MLFEARHYQRMGSAIWLYGWLVLRQTHQSGGLGWVLGGAPVSYREIEEETGFNRRTLESWMHTLRAQGYIHTEAAPDGVIIRITKAKKFPHPGRKLTGGVRRSAEGCTQSGVGSGTHAFSNQEVTRGIGSTSIARLKQDQHSTDFHRDFNSPHQLEGQPRTSTHPTASNPNPSCVGQNQNKPKNPPVQDLPQRPFDFFKEARLRMALLRAEREEAVRRELAVGTGPEVPHR